MVADRTWPMCRARRYRARLNKMAASMNNVLRLLRRFRKREMQTNSLTIFSIIHFRRRLATVTNYQTTADGSLSELTTFRNHPGVMRSKQVKLPEALQQNINKYLADKPVTKLKPHAVALCNYLWSRSQPLEESGLREKAQGYAKMQGVEDIDGEMLHSQDISKDSKKKIASIMNKLRKHIYNWQPITYDETTVCTYTMARMAPSYATIHRVFHEIKKRIPDFSPQAILDFGSGIGTATWAAHTLWGESIKEYYCVDISRPMHDVAEALMGYDATDDEQNNTLIKGVYFRHFLPMSLQKTYDLTISAYSLLELPSKADRLNTLQTLWRKTDQFLVLIECGTNEGYKTIMEARDFILNGVEEEENQLKHSRRVARGVARGVARDVVGEELELAKDPVVVVGHVFAPCQHDLACPRFTDGSRTPCNFEQHFHNFTTSGQCSELTSERFCYLVLRKGPRISGNSDNHWPRIVRPVLSRSRHVICRLCCSNGQLQETVITRAKHGRELYRSARQSRWGDLLPISRPEDSSTTEEERDTDGESSGSD